MKHSRPKPVQETEKDRKPDAQCRTDALEGIRRGLESMKSNAGKPAEEFFQEFFAEKGISSRK